MKQNPIPRKVWEALNELKAELLRTYGERLRGLYLYGSYARGDFTELGRHFVQAGLLPHEMHQWLREAFAQRQVCDYEFISKLGEEDVRGLEAKAEKFVSTTEDFLKTKG